MTSKLGRGAAAAFAATLGIAGAALAQAAFGPAVGATAPALGALSDQNGRIRQWSDLSGPRGAVLVFYRSAGWCPYCQAQLIAMNAGATDIERRGYRIVGLSYDSPAVTKAFADRRRITYALLSDPNSQVIDRWGLRDPQYAPGSRAYGVPRPAIFVLDRKGVVRAVLAEARYQDRPPVEVVLKTLDSLR